MKQSCACVIRGFLHKFLTVPDSQQPFPFTVIVFSRWFTVMQVKKKNPAVACVASETGSSMASSPNVNQFICNEGLVRNQITHNASDLLSVCI